MHTFIALSPVLLALSLMLFLRQPAARALAGSWLLAALLCLMVWRMDVQHVLAYSVLGFLSAIDILLIMCLTIFFRGRRKFSLRPAFEILPFALFSGAVFTVPYYLIAHYIGPELPVLLGSMIAMAVVVFAAKKGFLMPGKVWRFDGAAAPAVEVGEAGGSGGMAQFKAWLPYMVIAVVLVVTRVPSFGLKPLVTGTSLTVANIMGIEKLDWTWRYLNNPGLIFLAVAPYIGVLGAFVAGSHTVSNILFAPLQFKAANLLALSPVLVVSLQSVGGAIGNMTCINNVVAVCATTGVTSGEGRIIVRNLIPTLIYATLATLIALLLA